MRWNKRDMVISRPSGAERGTLATLLRWLRYAILAAIAAFVIRSAANAVIAAFANDDFPEALAVKVELLPVVFPVHMVTGGLALVLVPLALAARRWPRWHPLAGRIAGADVLVSGLTAYPVAWTAAVTFWSSLGFSAQATIWLALLALGVAHARAGRTERHRACMLLMLAATSGALFFRIYLALWAIFAHGRHFALFYACDAWVAWLLPLALTALMLKQAGETRALAR